MTDHLDAFAAVARDLAAIAIAEFRAHDPDVAVVTKADGSPVTAIDQAVEAAIRRHIEQALPTHGIIGEEYGSAREDSDWVWIIDPIDGTRQFAAGLPNFGVLIALGHQGIPVIGAIIQPMLGSVCLGVSGHGPSAESGTFIDGRAVRCAPIRTIGEAIGCKSDPDAFDAATLPGFEAIRQRTRWNVYDGGCLGYAALAKGRIGLCLNGPNLEPFDIAALVPVVHGAGGCISDWQGRPLTTASHGAIVASATDKVHGEVMDVLAGAGT